MAFLFTLSSCWLDNTKPNYQYMPDMYKSVGYETYSQNPNFANGMTSQLPVEGTIARGKVPYDYEDSTAGYDAALLNLKNPLEVNEVNLAKGKAMFTIYCISCHGAAGAGDHRAARALGPDRAWRAVRPLARAARLARAAPAHVPRRRRRSHPRPPLARARDGAWAGARRRPRADHDPRPRRGRCALRHGATHPKTGGGRSHRVVCQVDSLRGSACSRGAFR